MSLMRLQIRILTLIVVLLSDGDVGSDFDSDPDLAPESVGHSDSVSDVDPNYVC